MSLLFRVVIPESHQKDGSLKGQQTFHADLDQAVTQADTNGGDVWETIEARVSPERIAAARSRITAKLLTAKLLKGDGGTSA